MTEQEPQEEKEDEVVKVPERAQLLVWVERLAAPELCPEERQRIAECVKQALLVDAGNEHPPPGLVGSKKDEIYILQSVVLSQG